MADKSAIGWTDATWNPVVGCAVISPGCANCYAMREAERSERLFRGQGKVSPYAGLTRPSKAGAVWTGEVRVNETAMTLPLRWTRPRRVFVDSMSDLFVDGVDDAAIDRVFAVMALAPQHTFQLLTKRPERMRAYLSDRLRPTRVAEAVMRLAPEQPLELLPAWPLPHLHAGVSVEDHTRLVERVPILLDTPAAVRWISAEPLLGPLTLAGFDVDGDSCMNALAAYSDDQAREDWGDEEAHGHAKLDWVVVGGESGPGARPMHPAWVRRLRDDCAAAGVPFDFKQWGDWAPAPSRGPAPPATAAIVVDGQAFVRVGKRAAGRLLDGVEHNGRPEAMR